MFAAEMKPAMLRCVARDKKPHSLPDGHFLVPGLAIGGLSLVLAAGLAALRALDRLNAVIADMVSRGGAEKFPKHLPDWLVWLAAVVFAFGVAFAILGTSGQWRRAVFWITSVVLVSTWAPVLSLAAHAPDIAAPWIATVWSGVCALVYAANHRMASDPFSSPADEPR